MKTKMATAQRAMARWATTTTMMIAMGEDNDCNNGNGATGDEVDNDSNGATGNGATGYEDDDNEDNNNNDDGDGAMGDEVGRDGRRRG